MGLISYCLSLYRPLWDWWYWLNLSEKNFAEKPGGPAAKAPGA